MSALPILDIQQNSFRIRTSNFNSVLSKVGHRPFVLISINGATRTGKSFALNYVIRYLTFKTGRSLSSAAESWVKLRNAPKFVARGERTRTTMGIDLWSEPFIMKDPANGREVAVLLMDCQRLFDDQTTARQNAIIFSLSSLCSSMSVFNVMRNIDESILQQIQFFSGYAHLVSWKKETENGSGNEQSEEDAFQRLIFLLRDFDFPDYDFGYHGNVNGGTSSDNYCRDVFKTSAGCERPPENKFVREEILRSYKDVGCFLMPHPGSKFTRDENEPTEEGFEQYMKEFVELVLSPQNLVTKRIGGQEICGNDFKKFVEEWEKLCEKADDHFLVVQTILESTAIIQNTLALNTASAHYEKAMNSYVEFYPRGLSASEFLSLHETLKHETLELFNSIKKLGGEKLADRYRNSLVEHTEKIHESSRQLNLILLSNGKTDEELAKSKQTVLELQNRLRHLEIQNRREKEQQEKVIQDLQRKMEEDSKANEERWKFYQDQLPLAAHSFQAKAVEELERNTKQMRQLQRKVENLEDLQKRRGNERQQKITITLREHDDADEEPINAMSILRMLNSDPRYPFQRGGGWPGPDSRPSECCLS